MTNMKESDRFFLRVYHRLKNTNVLGPGTRYAIWLQGCDKNCPFCMSPETRDRRGGFLMDVKRIYEELVSCDSIEGITVSGGEPFLQFSPLYELLRLIKTGTDLSVVIYTGYYLQELAAKNEPKIHSIINDLSDIIIDGPYLEELNDGLSLRGSSNQNIHVLSDRYKQTVKELYGVQGRRAEIRLSKEEAFLIGIPDKNGYEMWKRVADMNGV